MELVLKSIAFPLPMLSHSISILSYLWHLPPLRISNTSFTKVPTNNSRNFRMPNIHLTSNRIPRNIVRIIKPPLAPFTYVSHNGTVTFYVKTLLLCFFLFFFTRCRFRQVWNSVSVHSLGKDTSGKHLHQFLIKFR